MVGSSLKPHKLAPPRAIIPERQCKIKSSWLLESRWRLDGASPREAGDASRYPDDRERGPDWSRKDLAQPEEATPGYKYSYCEVIDGI